jgi:nucleoside triphosphate pyrophosphatase
MEQVLVLASGSATRRTMLEKAGLSIVVDKPDVDEGAVKIECRDRGLSPGETAQRLAAAKAIQVSPRHPGSIVLGADQMLDCQGEWFDKPVDRAAAARQIGRLSGRTHSLFSAVAAVRDGAVIWEAVDSAELSVRVLSAEFIWSYLDLIGDAALSSVGSYQVEGLGIQLFDAMIGDHSTILGMPLIPLLAFLREQGAIAS